MHNLAQTLTFLEKTHRLNATTLAQLTGISTPTISRMKSGNANDPKLSTLKPIADYFKLSIEQLVGYEPLPSRYAQYLTKNQRMPIAVPLISWHQAGHFEAVVRALNSRCWYDWISTHAKVSALSYALLIEQANLKAPFHYHDIIVVDPQTQPRDQDDVIILGEKADSCILRKWVTEADTIWLQPLRTDFDTRILNKTDKLCGVIQQILCQSASQHRKRK